jgi:hypothetical protein
MDSMKKQILCVLALIGAMKALSQPDTTLAVGTCATCDTLYKRSETMPDGSPMIRKVTCYYAGKDGNLTKDIYSVTHFKNGLKHGFDNGYYQMEEGLYLTFLNRPYNKQPPSRFIRVIHEIIKFYPRTDRYSAYWRNGLSESITYYDLQQRRVDSLSPKFFTPYDDGWSSDVDLSLNGDNQVLLDEGDTLWRWNVRNNQLDGDLLVYGKENRVEWRYTFDKGQLIWKRRYRNGQLRIVEKYDRAHGPSFAESWIYDAQGELKRHLVLGPDYSYRAAKYEKMSLDETP